MSYPVKQQKTVPAGNYPTSAATVSSSHPKIGLPGIKGAGDPGIDRFAKDRSAAPTWHKNYGNKSGGEYRGSPDPLQQKARTITT